MQKKIFFIFCLIVLCSGFLFSNNYVCKTADQLKNINVSIRKCELPAGIGDVNQRMLGIKITNENKTSVLKQVYFSIDGSTDIKDIKKIKLYYTADSNRFFIGKGSVLLGTVKPGKKYFNCNQRLNADSSFFWITYDVSKTAKEGNLLVADIDSLKIDSDVIAAPKETGSRVILLTHTLLFSGGDGGSKSYRIPAIVTAPNGALIAATDKRWSGSLDLPNDIDVLISRSYDKGKNWTKPMVIAGENTEIGYGDPALCVDKMKNNIICLMAYGPGLWGSTASNPLRVFQSISSDNGVTWSTPKDITNMIYGAECENEESKNWLGAFVASGAFVQFSNGRLAAVIAARRNPSYTLDNFMIYSDDNAETWHLSTSVAEYTGDEAKLVELADKLILMSIRNPKFRRFNKSYDFGNTWGEAFSNNDFLEPNCNGDIVRYSCVNDGHSKNRILHSIPFASTRKNVSVLLSYDEGKSWNIRKTIYSGPSAYSALCVLDDGTIGIYYEVGEYEEFQMYFARFSLDWLTDGTDHGESF